MPKIYVLFYNGKKIAYKEIFYDRKTAMNFIEKIKNENKTFTYKYLEIPTERNNDNGRKK